MSDTDDTDALLRCDPGGGIDQLLQGKRKDNASSSQLECATPLKSSTPVEVTDKATRPLPSSSAHNQVVCKSSNSINKSLETSLDVSDYFNSDGELVLPGTSQLLESTFFDLNQSEGRKGTSSGENADYSSDQSSTTSTVESNTVVPSSSRTLVHKEGLNKDSQKILNDKSCKSFNKSRSAIAKLNSSESVPKEIQSELKRQLFQANSSNPEAQSILEDNSSHISYGVLNLNLNDLKTFAEGLSLCNFFPPSPKVSTFVPTQNDKGEQVFVRAPNFRTPGGYKPPRNPRKCRDLSDEQIREEVRKMYAFPDADEDHIEEQEKTDSENSKSENLRQDGESKASEEKLKVDFNFLDGSPIPNEFGKGKSGKPIKRKLLPNGGNICGGTIGSIPDLGFGLRSLSSDEVKEPIVERSVTWTTTGQNQERKQGESNAASEHAAVGSGGFSFGFGEEETYSPIKASDVSSCNDQENSSVYKSERTLHSPDKRSPVGQPNAVKKESTTSVNKIESRSCAPPLDENGSSKSADSLLLDTHATTIGGSKQKPSTPKRRIIRKAASKHRGMASPRSVHDSTTKNNITPPVGSIASDLEKILSEIDIPSDELESLIENLNESDGDLPGGVGLFEGIDSVDGNLVDAFSHLKLDSWQSPDTKLSEKYQDERVKREQCEKELRKLQESFLAEKQHNAVLEGTLKRRNVMLMQITVAFNRVCKEWKKFDAENKAAVTKLQHDQKLLAVACKTSRERISQYEKELHQTLEMADSFKSKLNDVQNERDASVMLLKENNNELEEKIVKLKEDMELLRNERDATLRALREAQVRLDEGKFSLENMESQIKSLEERDFENCQRYEELLQAKTQQDSSLMEVLARKSDLENMVINLKTELELEKSSKDQLKKTLKEEADRKSKLDAERLHDYYNKKVQEILRAATEEASTAESLLKDQMRRAAIESERRLAECKERFLRELDCVKAKYEAEIEKLKRENLHKQLLISSTVKQLQLGDSSNIDVSTAIQQSRPSQTKDILEVLKSQACHNTCENVYNGSGISNLTKFTLDHLPSIVPLQHQGTCTSKENGNSLQNEIPLEHRKAFVRYKTSTPIDNRVDPQSKPEANANAGGDFRRTKSVGNQASYSDGNARPNLDKVCGEKLVKSDSTPDCTDLKNVLSHLLEAPVKPEKELQMSNLLSNGKLSDARVDPALQKCIQELLKSYSDKLTNDSSRTGASSSSTTPVVSVHVGVGNNNDHDDNVNKNARYNDNIDSERSQQCSTSESLASQLSNRSEARKCTTKTETTSSQQQQQSSSQLKPPWK